MDHGRGGEDESEALYDEADHRIVKGSGSQNKNAGRVTSRRRTVLWNPWGSIINLRFNGLPNKVYVVRGTTLNRKWNTADK